MNEVCLIPRNLRRPDNIIQKPIKLNMKQIIYIGAGIGGAYFAFGTTLPLVYKCIAMGASFGAGIFGGLFKYEGSSIDELATDSLVFIQRKNYYRQLSKRSELIVNIGANKEESTVATSRVSFTIQSS